MPVEVEALISALQSKIDQAPDVPGNAVQHMSTTAQTAIKGVLGSGAPLHVRSGRLLGSVRQTYFAPGVVAFAHVAPTAIYSRIQELGGVSGKDYRSKLPPRPYVRPAVMSSMDQFHSDAVDAIRSLFW
jgi:phage gpG-like protein